MKDSRMAETISASDKEDAIVESSSTPHSQMAETHRSATQAATTSGASNSSLGPTTRHTRSRILCPVAGCLEASISSNKHFRDFASIKSHLNAHCTGYLTGAVPLNFLREYSYTQCQICDKVLHSRYNGTCPGCRPIARAQEQMNMMRNQGNPQSSTAQQHPQIVQQPEGPPSLSAVHEKFVPIIKNVPLKARRLWSQCLAKAMSQAVWYNNVESWTELQMLPKCTLCRPSRGGGSHSNKKLAWTIGRLQRWLAGERAELWHDLPQYRRPKPKHLSAESEKTQRQERCIKLTGEGGLSHACKALVSPPPLGHTTKVKDQLEAKHPQAVQPVDLRDFGNASSNLVPPADVEQVERGIRSFHRLSGGGPSGLRPVHLKNCISTEYRDEILGNCTSLVNLLAKGDAPLILAPYLAGATLTALPKRDDDVRPVAVGEVWRRLTAKILCNSYKEEASTYFLPLQIGVAQALGTEAGLETARQWCNRNQDNRSTVFAKIDFTNAFNCVNRQAFLEQCRHKFPGLSRWAEWCYAQPSRLYFGADIISSERGVQQGDPLGPLFFSLALQPLLFQLNEGRTEEGLQLVFSYLDDLVLAGEQQAVAEAFHHFKGAALDIGLEFNNSKCEIIPTAGLNCSLNKDFFPEDIIYREDGNFELLGGPIGSKEFCNLHTQKRVDKAKEVLSALGELPDPQVAFILLRHCASFSKLVYSLRVVPHHKHKAALQQFDNAIRDCIESFLCCSLSNTEWTLATLSTKMGGLGLRSTEHHSPAAFISSQTACHELCTKLDPNHSWDPNSPQTDSFKALRDFNDRVSPDNKLQFDDNTCPRQQTLSHAIDSHTLESIREFNKNDVRFQAHLNHTSASGAGLWLHSIPSKALNTHTDGQLFRIMVQRWLRVQLYEEEFHCPYCDEIVDRYADHCLTCACGGDRTKRHNLLRNEVFYLCNSSGLSPELERPGLLELRPLIGVTQESGARRDPNVNRRPADVYIPRWRRGAPAALDLAVTSGLRNDLVTKSAEDGSAAVNAYEDFKRTYLNTEAICQEEGITFIPLVCEADGGGWGPAAHRVWSVLAKYKSVRTGEQDSTIATHLLQSLGLILHRENARAILRRTPNSLGRDCSELLAASATCGQ